MSETVIGGGSEVVVGGGSEVVTTGDMGPDLLEIIARIGERRAASSGSAFGPVLE